MNIKLVIYDIIPFLLEEDFLHGGHGGPEAGDAQLALVFFQVGEHVLEVGHTLRGQDEGQLRTEGQAMPERVYLIKGGFYYNLVNFTPQRLP